MTSAKQRILDYFLQRVGQKVTTKELQAIAGISDYQRRIRELRKDDGYEIVSDKDRADLKPGEYILASATPGPSRQHGITQGVRRQVLIRNGLTCQMCGHGAEETYPDLPGRKVTLQVDHIDPNGPSTPDNLRTICAACHEGRSDRVKPSPEVMNALQAIRAAPRNVQRDVYDFLKNKFNHED